MIKKTAMMATLAAMTMMITVAQTEAQNLTFKNKYGSVTIGNRGSRTTTIRTPVIRTISRTTGRTYQVPVSSNYGDVRLRGKWVINGDDGTTTRLSFNSNTVSMAKTDEWGDVDRRDDFFWRASTTSRTSRDFTFQLKHQDGTIETYEGKFNRDRSKALMVTEEGEEMILVRAGRRFDDF